MAVYYNEIDPYAAQWLRNLIAAGHIAPGDVDERSIVDVQAADVRGYTQCHFFAGIGGWSLALRLAGWADDRPVWTGSCPCQPFSSAGKGGGFADKRHLWPDFFRLIEQCRPSIVFGEQVASRDGLAWLDLVHSDLERASYAAGAADLCAAGIGAPHIRQRLWWVGVSESYRPEMRLDVHRELRGERLAEGRYLGGLADADECRQPGQGLLGPSGYSEASADWKEHRTVNDGRGGGLADASGETAGNGGDSGSGPTDSFWRDADWLFCRDGKWRPVEPGTFPLAHGVSNRVGRLRAYGNAIVPQVAAKFIGVYLDT